MYNIFYFNNWYFYVYSTFHFQILVTRKMYKQIIVRKNTKFNIMKTVLSSSYYALSTTRKKYSNINFHLYILFMILVEKAIFSVDVVIALLSEIKFH